LRYFIVKLIIEIDKSNAKRSTCAVKELDYELIRLYMFTRTCGGWISLGKELGVHASELHDLRKQYGNMGRTPNIITGQLNVLSMFRSLYRNDVHRTTKMLKLLANYVREMPCPDHYTSIGIFVIIPCS